MSRLQYSIKVQDKGSFVSNGSHYIAIACKFDKIDKANGTVTNLRRHISSYWNSPSDWFGKDLEYWYGVDADFGNQSSSNIFSVAAEMNIGHAADTAQENWSCNIFDVIVVTAGYGKNSTGEGLDKWWWNSTYWIGDCNVDQKIDIFDSTWITGQYGKW